MDELLVRTPEPCDTCKSGIAKFVCFDELRRCQTCIMKFIVKDMEIVPAPLPVVPPAFVKQKRKKRKPGDDDDQQNLFG